MARSPEEGEGVCVCVRVSVCVRMLKVTCMMAIFRAEPQ